MSASLLLLLALLLPQEPVPSSVEAGLEAVEALRETGAADYEIGQAMMALARRNEPAAAEALAALVEELNGPLREAAIRALGACASDNRFDLLGEIVEDSRQLPDRLAAASVMVKLPDGRAWLRDRFKKLDDAQVQAMLIRALDGSDPDDADLIERGLKARNPTVQAVALRKAAELKLPDGRKVALKALGDSNLAVRRAAAEACGTYGGEDAFEELAEAAEDARAPELRAALRRGMRLASTEEEVQVLVDALDDARETETQGLIALALIVAGVNQPQLAGPAFARLLEEKDQGIRQLAVRGIEATAHEAALDQLTALLEHESFQIRADAVRAMAAFESIPVEHAERIASLTRDMNRAVRLCATLALGSLPEDRALASLEARLQDEDWAVRDAAVEVLAEMRTVPAVRLLAEHMGRAKGLVRDETYQRLKGLTGQDFGPATNAWKAWIDDRPEDYELPSAEEAQRMIDELEERRATINQGYGAAEYHGLAVRPGGVLFILDVSGSMGFNYTPDAQLFHDYFVAELRATIESLTGEHEFGIVAFSSGARAWRDQLVQGTDENKKQALAFLDGLAPYGATHLSAALGKAFDTEGVQQVYLMTDGDPTQGMTLKSQIVDWVAEKNRNRRIRFHTIVAGDVDGDFLAELAALNGGTSVDLREGFEAEELPEDAGQDEAD